ncbi:hypothetical protein D3C78_977940 [compost metagenome]
MGNSRLRNPVQGIKIGLHGAVEIVGRQFFYVFAILLSRGVDDQNIQPVEIAGRLLYQFAAPCLIGNIAGQRDRHATFRLDERHDLLSVGFLFRQIGDRHISTFPCKGDGDGAADT